MHAPRRDRPESQVPTCVVVVMGVSGSGKTTVGKRLAARLQVEYVDGDDLQPMANVAKMAQGQALTDEERWPWLDNVAGWLGARVKAGAGGVVSCSALRRVYRDILRTAAPDAVFVHLAGPEEVVTNRILSRKKHFMPATLVPSQYAALEPLGPDELGVTLPLEDTASWLVSDAIHWLRKNHPDSRTVQRGRLPTWIDNEYEPSLLDDE